MSNSDVNMSAATAKAPVPREPMSAPTEGRPTSSARGPIVFGLIIVLVIFIGIGGWSSIAPLAKAVSAPAVLVVRGERKKIQHLEGGLVEQIFVSEGDIVKEGELLAKLDSIQAKAMFMRYDNQLDQALAYKARLSSELDNEETVILPGDLLERLEKNPKVLDAIENEERQLLARRETFVGHIGILEQRIAQLRNEIKGLTIQRQARLEQYDIYTNEIAGLRELNKKGFFPLTKLLAMERAMVNLRGEIGAGDAAMARSASAMGEAERQIINVRQEFRESVVKELRDISVSIADLYEQVAVARDILDRIEIRSPRAGVVQGVKIHTIGGVIGTGEVLMEIVPKDEQVLVDVKVKPTDIDSVEVDQTAEVRLTALNMRTTPAIYGKVLSISGDALNDTESRTSYFHVRVELPPGELNKIEGVRLSAGMPAEVLIQTGERTALDYLLRPLTDAFKRGLNEE
ncbi:HlyD family type I secretion periplasmic adaptor subunit [Alphaproteobacteria bacterium]|nr:HlyD family type I secretion periplasmic adaptor subunit [Alphaproteobacteria bacterium]